MKPNQFYKISDSPLIVVASASPVVALEFLPPSNARVHLLIHPMWYFGVKSTLTYIKQRHLLNKKNIQLVLLCNSKEEYLIAKAFGFRAYFINQNLHVCENQYKILPGTEKIYDAVYTASAKPFKRIHLAEEIEKLYVITYFWPKIVDEQGNWDLHTFEPRVRHAHFNRRHIDPEQMNILLNQSCCGLALSKREGAMFGSMEYLMAGLPIVSTRSKGGRDVFFDKSYVKIVSDTSSDVKAGVDYFKTNRVNPEYIRDSVMKKVNEQRNKFYEVVCSLYQQEGCESPHFDTFYQSIWGEEGISKHRLHKL